MRLLKLLPHLTTADISIKMSTSIKLHHRSYERAIVRNQHLNPFSAREVTKI